MGTRNCNRCELRQIARTDTKTTASQSDEPRRHFQCSSRLMTRQATVRQSRCRASNTWRDPSSNCVSASIRELENSNQDNRQGATDRPQQCPEHPAEQQMKERSPEEIARYERAEIGHAAAGEIVVGAFKAEEALLCWRSS